MIGPSARILSLDPLSINWMTPQFSKTKVDKAGRQYVDPETSQKDRELARLIINNWRSSHSFPLNTIQTNLRKVAMNHDEDATVAQRLKRLPSIRKKLVRFGGMRMTQIQDIGGCRAVLRDIQTARDVTEHYRRRTRMKHELVNFDDYLECPQKSGYRGQHLVYAYHSDKNATYNGLKIEIQVRSRLQHAWATAVETVDMFTQQALKSSSGTEEWMRFFALASSAIAEIEGTAPVPNTPDAQRELLDELAALQGELNALERLQGFGQALKVSEEDEARDARFFVLILNTATRRLSMNGFSNEIEASAFYADREGELDPDPAVDVVMVRVQSMDTIRNAFPNYFLDTTAFVNILTDLIGEGA